jgi:hypothetical protein
MRVLLWLLIVVGLVPGFARRTAWGQPAGAERRADESPPPVDEWIADLESDIYSVRVRATERLILAGSAAIEPLTKAVEEGELETISRGVYILRQLAMSPADLAAEEQAYRALEQLSRRRFSGASRRAATALQAVHEMRQQRAQERLAQLGAVFALSPVQVTVGVRDSFPSVEFGPTWRGTPADFAQVAWITAQESESPSAQWMIIIDGHQVTDDWMDRIVGLKNVAVVKLKSAQVSDEAIGRLAGLKDLEILELLYTPISDAAVDHLAALPKLARLRLIGTRITAAGHDRLQQQVAQAEIDFRNGGFLGVGCTDNPCQISLVQPNSAAAAAGMRVEDIITGYNGQPVQTMDELTRLISQDTVGDKVSLELLRKNERITVEVELGAWD